MPNKQLFPKQVITQQLPLLNLILWSYISVKIKIIKIELIKQMKPQRKYRLVTASNNNWSVGVGAAISQCYLCHRCSQTFCVSKQMPLSRLCNVCCTFYVRDKFWVSLQHCYAFMSKRKESLKVFKAILAHALHQYLLFLYVFHAFYGPMF